MTRAALLRYVEALDLEIELLLFDPPEVFDPAILGIVIGFGQEPAILYDLAIVREGYLRSGLSEEDLEEWLSFNTIGAYVGPSTPRFLERIPQP